MNKVEVLKVGSILLIMAALLWTNASSALTLDEYLQQVKQENLGVKSSTEQSVASKLRGREADLYFTPKLFANAQTGEDGKVQFASPITYDNLKLQNYSLGVSQDFSFGLQTKLSYQLNRTEVFGAILPAGTPSMFWDATPLLEVSLPIWGKGFGREARANEELVRSQNEADKLGADAQTTGYLVEAEAAYWRLSSANEVVEVQKRASQHAQGILDYVSRKARMNLGENADVLQAKALVEQTTFQLQQAINSEKAARRSFNTYINKPAEQPVAALDGINFDALQNVVVPAVQPGDRNDVKAAEAQVRSAKSSAQLAVEKNKPTFDVYGSYAMNGQNQDLNEALKAAGRTSHDTSFVGVRLNIPLNLGASADARAGALKAQLAADSSYQYKRFTQEQDWTNLVQQLAEAKESLRLATNIVSAQKAKLENERTRLRQGRTTTYQVLLFEQDFSQSEVTRVQTAAQILNLQAQLKLYQNNNQPASYQTSMNEGGK